MSNNVCTMCGGIRGQDCLCAPKESMQIWSGQGFVVWFSEGDHAPYWVSDSQGYELEAFETEQEAIDYVTKGA